jgi:Caspase domain
MIAWLAAAALGGEVRYGLFVGNDLGLPGDPELVFAELDAVKMRDLFVDYGQIKASDAVLLTGGSAGMVQRELVRLTSKIGGAVANGDEVTLVFYYSGHGDADGLHLNGTRLEHDALRLWIERSGAAVKLGIVDACQSGGLVRKKGGERGETFAFAQPRLESSRGSAYLTSSAASELSQESREIGGGFFTHHVHSALLGAGDANGDGAVSLAEAYAYVYTETAFQTREAPEAQTPQLDIDLSGAGEIVLTELEAASARLSFSGELEGTFGVWDESRRRYVAQVDGDDVTTVAVRPGTFYVQKRMPGWVEEARYVVHRGETTPVDDADFLTVSYTSAASRGDLDKIVRRAKVPDLSLRFVAGVRNFSDPSYVLPLAVGGIQGMWLGQQPQYFAFDLRTGANSVALGVTGLSPITSHQSFTTLSAASGLATRPGWVRAGIGGKASLATLSRQFPDWDVAPQVQTSIAFGTTGWVGASTGRFSVDLQLDWQLLVMKLDTEPGWPSFADLVLTAGVRL